MRTMNCKVDEMVAWALAEIEECRRVEAKFGADGTAITAATQRRTLEHVLGMLGVAVPPISEEHIEYQRWSSQRREAIHAKPRTSCKEP
jgi:hypothetical protein